MTLVCQWLSSLCFIECGGPMSQERGGASVAVAVRAPREGFVRPEGVEVATFVRCRVPLVIVE